MPGGMHGRSIASCHSPRTAKSLRRRNSRLRIRPHPPLRPLAFVKYEPTLSSNRSVEGTAIANFRLRELPRRSLLFLRLPHQAVPLSSAVAATPSGVDQGQFAVVNRISLPSWLTEMICPGEKRPSSSAVDSGLSKAR